MKYLKVWTSFRDIVKPLSEAEIGRLFLMMMEYAENGTEPGNFAGNERFIWPTAKQIIDLAEERNEKLRANASKGGLAKSRNQQALADDSKSYQSLAKDSKDNQSEANGSSKEKKRKEKESNEKDIRFAQFWSVYPRHVAKQDARKKFDALNPDDELLDTMIKAIEVQMRSEQWTKDGGQFIPHPATWIHQRRWEDELAPRSSVKVSAQSYSQRDYSGEQDEAMQRMIRNMIQEGA